MPTNHHILNAACNLLGISLLIIAGLHISNRSGQTMADEVAWISAICFSASCVFSYLSIRADNNTRSEVIADKVFLLGLFSLLASVAILAMSNVS
ncbi:MAG TPA: hypothetical protein VF503_22560 [Sphingobium sp.]|uniref:hypothetical protein n=1 Tax=Sphingobium sp. TaxID=1912891 RepID=UPI002ED4B44B